MAIENEQFIKIGNFIDQRQWLTLVVSGIITFTTMYIYNCAVSKMWKLPLRETFVLVLFVVITRFLSLYDVNLASGIMTMSMFIIPTLLKSDLKIVASIFSIHYMSQLLSLKIRNLPFLLTNINSVIAIAMSFETYLWLLLLYLYSNYKKGRN